MNGSTLSSFVRRLLFSALLVPCLARADDGALAAQLLALDAQIHRLETQSAPPAALGVFIASRAEALRLRKLVLRIDDQPPATYEYGEPEWEALHAGGLHPALWLALPPGAHRLRVELFARTLDAGPNDPRAVANLDQALDLAPGQTLLEIGFTQARFGRAALDLRGVDAAQAWSRAARFWLDADRPYTAARLLHRGPTAEGAALLAESLARLSGRAAADASSASEVATFNAAVAAQDLPALETIGTAKAQTNTAWTLRDHANLLLGYAALRAGRGAQALEAFARVRSPGPHGNAALLGFGWAFLIPAASATNSASPSSALADRPAFVAAIAQRKPQAEALKRALVPWTELIGRDPLDLDAQEGALALAWALDQLGTGAQSHTYYERAAAQLEQARALLDQAMQHVAAGHAAEAATRAQNDSGSGWRRWLSDLPYAQDTAYFKYLLADTSFVATLDRYRNARLLRDELEGCAQRLRALPDADALSNGVAALTPRAQHAERAARVDFEQRALNLLRERKQQTERYLVEARLALARHFDRAPAGARS